MKHVLLPYLEDDCGKVLTYIDEHPVSSTFYRLPNWVTSMAKDDNVKVSNVKLSMPQLLYHLVRAITGGSNTVITVNPVTNPYNDMGRVLGLVDKNEYMRVATSVKNFIKNHKRAPNYVTVNVTYDSQKVSKKISMPSITLLFVNILNELAETQTYPSSFAIIHCV